MIILPQKTGGIMWENLLIGRRENFTNRAAQKG